MPSDAQTVAKPAARTAAPKPAAGARPMLEGRIAIFPERPYAELSTAEVSAFEAEDPMAAGDPRVAYICDVDPLPRIDVAEKLKGLARPGLTQIMSYGPVDWPGVNGERMAILISPPQGGRLVPPGAPSFAPMSSEMLLQSVIRPVVTGLTEMFHRNQTHRGIRADNLFYGDAAKTRVVLGQAVTAPAGFYQPSAYETIECSTADPESKGFGTRAEDMFSLGVTILALVTGKAPGAGIDSDELFARRIEKGSLDAYVDPREVPRDMIDGLRGLMTDEIRERWTLEQFKSWIEGNRIGAPRLTTTIRAHAGFEFNGRKLWTAPALALALSRKPQQAVEALRSGAVLDWMKKSLPDNLPTEAMAAVMAEFDTSGSSDDMLMAKASIAMDPTAPIRYGGYAVRLDGIGSALLSAQRKPGGVATLTEMLRANLPSYWLNSQPKHINRGIGVTAQLEKLGRWVSDAGPGAGMERCLYELNPALPCRSPITGGRWVSDPAALLPAIDASAASGGLSRQPIDRHIAAFLAARSHADTAQLLGLMQPQNVDDHSALGTLRLLAELQASFKAKSLPGLGAWCAELLRPVVDGFHHRKRRGKLLEILNAVARSGNLQAMLKLIDDTEFKRVDRRGFEKAKEQYSRAETELADLEKNAVKRVDDAAHTGREASALISSGLAVMTVGAMLLMRWL